MIDRKSVLATLSTRNKVILDIGCGPRKREPDWIGVDLADLPGVDLVGDAVEILQEFPSASVDEVHSYHFFEHLQDASKLLFEIARILKANGYLKVVVPHFSSPYFYSDPTHRSAWGIYTFSYLVSSTLFARGVPCYGPKLPLLLENVSLGFKSSKPFYARYVLKRVLGSIFNSCRYLQEFYEENLCYIFPCYEITFQLRRMPL